MLAVGYDDNIEISNSLIGGLQTKGALLVRNSMGANWGKNGYGWLPYDYVLKGNANDGWRPLKKRIY